MGLVTELRRRGVLRMAVLYAVSAWLIMQVAEVVIGLGGLPAWTGRATLAVLVIGFPIAIALSWFYELTPDGPQLDTDIERKDSRSGNAGRRMDFVVIAVLTAAVLVFAYDKWWLDQKIDASPNSVAVLPFVNVGGTPEDEYFSDGITRTLLHAVAEVPGIKVPSPTSVFWFKGKDIDLTEIAARLKVSKVLEGSVQRSGNMLRIVAQLVEVEDGSQLWSQTYDRDLTDIFAVQDDIANQVAFAMRATVAGGQPLATLEAVTTDNFEAYDRYLQGLQQRNINSFESLMLAETLFKAALARDPAFFEARLELAYLYRDQQEGGMKTFDEAVEGVRLLLPRLIEDRADDGRVMILTAWTQFVRSVIEGDGLWDPEGHLADLQDAVRRTPNEARLYFEIQHYMRLAGRRDEALEWIEKGIAVDPLDWRLHLSRGTRMLGDRNFDEAENSLATAIELNPDGPMAYAWLAEVLRHRGQHAEAFAMFRKAIDLGPLDHTGPALMALRLYALGLVEEGDRYWRRASTLMPDDHYVRIARLYRLTLLDDSEEARTESEQLLRNGVVNNDEDLSFVTDVYLTTMDSSGRFDEALAVMEELLPGITSPNFQPVGEFQGALHALVSLTVLQVRPTEWAPDDVAAFVTRFKAATGRYVRNRRANAALAMAQGHRDLAVEYALQELEEGFELHDAIPYAVFRFSAYLKAVAQEPEVATRLEELDSKADRAGRDIAAYIKNHDLQL